MRIIDKSLAPKYDETKTYKVDDVVVVGNKMYKCIEQISEPESFNSTKWERTYLVSEINSNLGNKIATQKVSITPFTISAAGVTKVSATFSELEEVYGITDYTLRYNWTSLLSSGNSISISGNTVTLTIFNPTGNSDSGIYGTITAVGKPK